MGHKTGKLIDEKLSYLFTDKIDDIYDKYSATFNFTFNRPRYRDEKRWNWSYEDFIMNYYVPNWKYDRYRHRSSNQKDDLRQVYDFMMPILQTAVWGLGKKKDVIGATSLAAMDGVLRNWVFGGEEENPFSMLFDAISKLIDAQNDNQNIKDTWKHTQAIKDYHLAPIGEVNDYSRAIKKAFWNSHHAVCLNEFEWQNLENKLEQLRTNLFASLKQLAAFTGVTAIGTFLTGVSQFVIHGKAFIRAFWIKKCIDNNVKEDDWYSDRNLRRITSLDEYSTIKGNLEELEGILRSMIHTHLYKKSLPKYDADGREFDYSGADENSEASKFGYSYSGSEMIFKQKSKMGTRDCKIDFGFYKGLNGSEFDWRFGVELRKDGPISHSRYATAIDKSIYDGNGDYVYFYHINTDPVKKHGFEEVNNWRIYCYSQAKYWFHIVEYEPILNAHKGLVEIINNGLFSTPKHEPYVLRESSVRGDELGYYFNDRFPQDKDVWFTEDRKKLKGERKELLQQASIKRIHVYGKEVITNIQIEYQLDNEVITGSLHGGKKSKHKTTINFEKGEILKSVQFGNPKKYKGHSAIRYLGFEIVKLDEKGKVVGKKPTIKVGEHYDEYLNEYEGFHHKLRAHGNSHIIGFHGTFRNYMIGLGIITTEEMKEI
ncbi:hypothetical protein JMN32_15195 [Fulvivirga sp. 29W222]|uniref:Jacalin-type lectin domain-containing protein n=1 Tax=Fulvivirga marina TaxID=2494733 RepID=A0A937KCL7_9BACT|nr:hypothetical protein [Fulvivirga marina]MBL6447662.1 hypothetical protein [Fulvivirga marina]